ncbi:MAG: aminotransferase class III-fold pyridoxal phosphate-dependent enzyme [Bacteroidota bacterium]
MIEKLSLKHKKSKEHTDFYRPFFALNRNASGFTKEKKELIYTLVCNDAQGANIFDVDGNKYIDLSMGFGSILFGHNFKPIADSIKEQLDLSWSVGPISPLAGKLAKEIAEACDIERVAFFNSGTEAIMVALRIAKTISKKNNIVFFKGSYHGTFDSLMSVKSNSETKLAQEIIPGITQSILNESFLLDYGSIESLDFIFKNKYQIAAVLVEPVQSRNPDFQPIEYLKELRELTQQYGIVLIFDEIITGFRAHIGGCQKLFEIQADIVTYGKVIGGGLPIGIVAGKAKFMDAIDGGVWKFNDDSYPKTNATFVAGTFCHHPLAMVAARKTLELLTASDENLLEKLNLKTTKFRENLNVYFTQKGLNIRVASFGSLFRFTTPGKSNLLYHQLLLNGVYVWEGRNCFFSLDHTQEIIDDLEERIKLSCEQLADNGIIKI